VIWSLILLCIYFVIADIVYREYRMTAYWIDCDTFLSVRPMQQLRRLRYRVCSSAYCSPRKITIPIQRSSCARVETGGTWTSPLLWMLYIFYLNENCWYSSCNLPYIWGPVPHLGLWTYKTLLWFSENSDTHAVHPFEWIKTWSVGCDV
jgi:hypothetical protein